MRTEIFKIDFKNQNVHNPKTLEDSPVGLRLVQWETKRETDLFLRKFQKLRGANKPW
jgi:hypothetical protein